MKKRKSKWKSFSLYTTPFTVGPLGVFPPEVAPKWSGHIPRWVQKAEKSHHGDAQFYAESSQISWPRKLPKKSQSFHQENLLKVRKRVEK